MRYVVFALMAFGALVAILSATEGLLSAGPHGIAVVVCGGIALTLGAVSAVPQRPFARWAAILCLLAFLVAGMKTSEADSLSGIMMAAFAGMLVSLALAIKPYRPAAA